MKTIILILVSAACLFGGGCASTAKNFNTFLANMPAVTATDITQTTTTPIYSHIESASGVVTSPSGLITVKNGKANASIPELGVSWSFSISGLSIQGTPQQLAAGKTIEAQAAASQPAAVPAAK